MKVIVCHDRIDITEIPPNHRIQWESILDELRAVHLPGLYQEGKRMGVSVVNGQTHAYIYRTAKTPTEEEIHKILKRHGIA